VSAASRAAKAFRRAAAFRAWLRAHHASKDELVVRCFKSGHERRGVTYRQALDEALCFGWIDGVRHGLDEASFSVRFTPRRKGSTWSQVNTRRFAVLRREGRIEPPGLAAFRRRRTPSYSYESLPRQLARSFRERLRAHPRAWAFFSSQPPWYRRTSAFWVMSAKREETRERRFGILLASSAGERRIPPLRRPDPSSSIDRRTAGRR